MIHITSKDDTYSTEMDGDLMHLGCELATGIYQLCKHAAEQSNGRISEATMLYSIVVTTIEEFQEEDGSARSMYTDIGSQLLIRGAEEEAKGG